MNRKLFITSLVILSVGAVGIIFAVTMEIATGEPIYWTVMKVTAGLFGIGGPLLGWGIVRRHREG